MNNEFSTDGELRKIERASGGIRGPVDLAHTPSFRIGAVEVIPPTRELVKGERRNSLEPKVMEVLVVLAAAGGRTLSRDDLIDACWGGRAVTDDAVQRVISRLRALGRTFADFEVETINKVGYRLIEKTAERLSETPAVRRRQVVTAGAAAAGLGLLGLATWRLTGGSDVPPEAEVLIQKGMDALQNNDAFDAQDPGSTLQAIALLTEATRAAPKSAVAWGGLAMAYAVRKRTADLSERPGLDSRGRAAAETALRIDPVEARALGALRLLDPVYRNWQTVERADREAVSRNPNLPILLFVMADMLGSVGRWKEAVEFSGRLDRSRFLIPGADRKLLIDLWSSGNLQGADSQLEIAVKQWPQHPQIWRTRLAYLMYTGRANEALALLRDERNRPIELQTDYFETVGLTAEALAGRRRPLEAVERGLAYLKVHPAAALQVAQSCVALRHQPAALAIFSGYYFAEGDWPQLAPKGGDQDRVTSPLFHPVMSPIWHRPEFSRLLERIGLEDYWRRSGIAPDYRRAA